MHTESVDVCVIEDDAAQRALLVRRLMRDHYSVVQAENGREGLQQIRRHHPRVVISDLKMPEVDGIEVCRQIRTDPALDGTYVIVVTAYDSQDQKHEALNVGADDYLTKPFDEEELAARLRNGLRINRLQERLRRAALTDGLTGLWNHTQFRQLLDQEFARTRRYGGIVSLLMIDLDHFKAVNDTYGHETGNRILKLVATHLRQTVRDIDIVTRYGGEEFGIICPQTNLDDATGLAERIRHSLPEKVRCAEHPRLNVTASIGVVCCSDARVNSVNDLVNLADQALYAGKNQGRNQVIRSDRLDAQTVPTTLQIGEVERLRKEVVALSMQAKELCLQSVWTLVQALEARDPYTAWHSRNVTFYTNALVAAAGLPASLRDAVGNAAMLHDLGKIGIPDRIIEKVEPLTQSETAALRHVPLMTCKILEPLRIFSTEILIIRHVRERFDGTGHPDGLVGDNIPIGSRLLAITEAFDAMTCDRVYRPHRSIDAAIAEILTEAGRHFDPKFADLLERVVREQESRWQEQIDRAQREVNSFAPLVR